MSKKPDKSITKSFSAESVEDIVEYFNFMSKEIERILKACGDKKEAIATLESFIAGKAKDEAVEIMLPNKGKAKEALTALKSELAEFEKEFDIVETLLNSCLVEVKNRVTIN